MAEGQVKRTSEKFSTFAQVSALQVIFRLLYSMYSPSRYIGHILHKSRPIHLTFFVTKKCNSKCPFCFYLKSASQNPPKNITPPSPPLNLRGEREGLRSGEGGVSDELTLAEIRQISKSMGSLLWLAFSGGEIFLRDDLVEISRVFYKNNKPSIMLYPTNGILPELIRDRIEQILKDCPKSVIAVKLSIDGLNKKHDLLRNTPGNFDKTMQSYDILGKLLNKYPNFELGVNTVFCSENQDDMDNIIDFVSGLKNIRTHTISLIRGNLSDKAYKNIDYRKYLHAIGRLEKNLKNKISNTYRFKGARIKAAQDILQRRLIYRTLIEQRQIIPCYAGRLNLVLTENGDVYPCELFRESLGNISDYDYDIQKVIQSEKAKKVINTIQNKQCFCTHECYFMTNILFNPRLYPELAREYMQL